MGNHRLTVRVGFSVDLMSRIKLIVAERLTVLARYDAIYAPVELSPELSEPLLSRMPLPPLPRKKRPGKPAQSTSEPAEKAQKIMDDNVHAGNQHEGTNERPVGSSETAVNH